MSICFSLIPSDLFLLVNIATVRMPLALVTSELLGFIKNLSTDFTWKANTLNLLFIFYFAQSLLWFCFLYWYSEHRFCLFYLVVIFTLVLFLIFRIFWDNERWFLSERLWLLCEHLRLLCERLWLLCEQRRLLSEQWWLLLINHLRLRRAIWIYSWLAEESIRNSKSFFVIY